MKSLWSSFSIKIKTVIDFLQGRRDPAASLKRGTLNNRLWRLFQIEPSLQCNIRCIMCPWIKFRHSANHKGLMQSKTWEAIGPHLPNVQSVDFTGGGEPLLQPNLLSWLRQAKDNGCETGFLTNGILLTRSVISHLMECDIDWIGFSVDSTTKHIYESIRRGAQFEQVCENIRNLAKTARVQNTRILINFVMMEQNIQELFSMVQLADDLGVQFINIKQCDVIRDEHGHGLGLFKSDEDKFTRKYSKTLSKISKIATRKNITVIHSAFIPNEQPICIQDPRQSLFISYEGIIGPCINRIYGGKSTFMSKPIEIQQSIYGRVEDFPFQSPDQNEAFVLFKQAFSERSHCYQRNYYDQVLDDPYKSDATYHKRALQNLPVPPSGCESCHYLYNI